MVVNPNNPTGTTLESRKLFDMARENPNTTYLIDESFIDFSKEQSLVNLLEEHPADNLIVIQSLSKSWGVPGLRLGFVYTTNTQFQNQIRSKLPIWNANSVAEFYLEIFLKHRKSYQDSLEQTSTDRDDLSSKLSELVFVKRVFESGADFILVELDGDANFAAYLTKRLLEQFDIYVKNISSKFSSGKGFLRIAVRLPTEHERLVQAMALACSNDSR